MFQLQGLPTQSAFWTVTVSALVFCDCLTAEPFFLVLVREYGREVREVEVNSEENYFLHSLGFQLNFFAALSHVGNLSVTPADGKCRRASGLSMF